MADWADAKANEVVQRSFEDPLAPMAPLIAAALREARLAGAPQWQPIETAPKDGTVILATDGECEQRSLWSGNCWRSEGPQSILWSAPTHWKPCAPSAS